MAKEKNRVLKAGFAYTIGNILVKGIAFLTIPVFSRLMTTDEYGIFNTYSAYVSMAAVILSLGLPSSVRNARYDLKEEEKEYCSCAVAMITLVFAAAFFLAFIFRTGLASLLKINAPLVLIVVVVSSATALHSLYNSLLTLDYRHEEFVKLSLFYSLGSVLCSVALILTLFRKETALGRAIGNAIPMIIIALYVIIQISGKKRLAIHKRYLTYGLKFGLPLIPNDLSSLVLNQFDRIMIYRMIGEAQSGIYSFAYNIAVIYQVITTSVDNAWTPWMFEQISQGRQDTIRRKLHIYMGILAYGTTFVLLGSPEAIVLLSPSSYWDSRRAVIPIVLAMYFFAAASVPVGIEFFYKKTLWISGCTFCAAILNILLNYYFIPGYGYSAAAYTTLACYFVYFCIHLFCSSRLLNLGLYKDYKLLLCAGSVVLIAVLGILFLNRPMIRWGIILLLLIAGMITAFKNKEHIDMFVKGLLKK